MSKSKIHISAKIDKDLAHVWDMYNNPVHITQWNAASEDWYCPECSNELRVGGQLNARMEAKDGSSGFNLIGTYTAVNPMQGFTYVMENGREVIARFEDLNGTTQVSISFDPEEEYPEEMQRQGWQSILNNFKQYAESH